MSAKKPNRRFAADVLSSRWYVYSPELTSEETIINVHAMPMMNLRHEEAGVKVTLYVPGRPKPFAISLDEDQYEGFLNHLNRGGE